VIGGRFWQENLMILIHIQNDGKDEVYKMICNGRHGTYDGKWVDLGGDHHKDYRVINCKSECNMHLNN